MDHATTGKDLSHEVEILRAMKGQETKHYALPGEYWETCFELNIVSMEEEIIGERSVEDESDSEAEDCTEGPCIDTYLEWRRKMIMWFFDVAKTCKYQTETIEVAINMIDRFMANSPRGNRIMQQSNEYQLVCMTCLYVASKTYEDECLSQDHVLDFTEKKSSIERLNRLELEILQTLDFRVNSPSRMAYVHRLLDLIPDSVITDKTQVHCLAEKQIEASLAEERFLPIQASTAAFCALMNAIQMCQPPSANNKRVFQLQTVFRDVLEIDGSSAYGEYLAVIQEELYMLISFEHDERSIEDEEEVERDLSASSRKVQKMPEQPLQKLAVGEAPTFVSAMAA